MPPTTGEFASSARQEDRVRNAEENFERILEHLFGKVVKQTHPGSRSLAFFPVGLAGLQLQARPKMILIQAVRQATLAANGSCLNAPDVAGSRRSCVSFFLSEFQRYPIHLHLHLCTPDSKRIASTTGSAHFLARDWPEHCQAVAKTFPGHAGGGKS